MARHHKRHFLSCPKPAFRAILSAENFHRASTHEWLVSTSLDSPDLRHRRLGLPFDTGGSDAVNDGVVLTRYALGITGAPLTASTRYASLDPLQVKANIECVGCALDINGDGVVDTVDTTIFARHLSGFTGASLTAGLALGANVTTASVVSFLANGCAVGRAINAFVHGGNTFALGAGVASVLGNNDNRALTIKAPQSPIKLLVDPANGDDGLRISYASNGIITSPNTLNGSRLNSVGAGVLGATIAGGGAFLDPISPSPNLPNQVNATSGASGGIRLPGAGVNQPGTPAKQSGTNMFTHQVPTTGPCQSSGPGMMFTAIDHPMTNNNPAPILVVPPNGGDFAATMQLGYKFPVAVFYESRIPASGAYCPQCRWVIHNAQYETVSALMDSIHRFDVLVINP